MTQNFSIGGTRNCTNSESSNNCTIYVEVGCSYKQKEDTLHQSLDWDITVQVNCSSGEDGGGDGQKLFCLLQDPELGHIPTATEEIRFDKKTIFFSKINALLIALETASWSHFPNSFQFVVLVEVPLIGCL